MLRKKILLGIIAVLLLLDWAALDDITTGNEPSLIGESLMIITSMPILATIGYHLFGKTKL